MAPLMIAGPSYASNIKTPRARRKRFDITDLLFIHKALTPVPRVVLKILKVRPVTGDGIHLAYGGQAEDAGPA